MSKHNELLTIASVAMLLLLIVGSSSNTAAQIKQPGQPVPPGWQVITGLVPSGVSLNSVYIPRTVDTPAGAFVAGNDGTGHGVVYALSQRGFGGPWSSQLDQSFPNPLRALVWLNGENVWAVGDGSLIAHRDASGWHQISSPVPNANLHAIQILGTGNEGWAAGATIDASSGQLQPALLHYKSGQWQQDNSITGSGDIAALSFDFAGDSGWLVGTVGIWHYQNGNWSKETTPALCAGCTSSLDAVKAISSDEAWAVGSSGGTCNTCMLQPYAIHRSGGNWQAVLPDTAIAGTAPVNDNYMATQLNAVYFTDANTGFAVGNITHSITRTSPATAAPLLIRYQNGNWSYDPLPIKQGLLNAVYATGPNTALAVGAQGLILSDGYGSSVNPSPTPGSSPATRVADPHDANVTYFDQTGHILRGPFRDYWNAHGGLAQFGYPITEQFAEGSGITSYMVQYFERNRFELHPENQPPFNVLLGLLGHTVTVGREGELPFKRTPAMANPAAVYFDATGHNLIGPFRAYWEQHGGLAIYGYPISEQFSEVSKTDGKTYMVQYFERNRFEFHPELPAPYQVSLGLLGVQVLQQRGWLP